MRAETRDLDSNRSISAVIQDRELPTPQSSAALQSRTCQQHTDQLQPCSFGYLKQWRTPCSGSSCWICTQHPGQACPACPKPGEDESWLCFGYLLCNHSSCCTAGARWVSRGLCPSVCCTPRGAGGLHWGVLPSCSLPGFPTAAMGFTAAHTHSDNSGYPFPPYTLEKADLGLEQAGFISAVFSTSDLLKGETYLCLKLLFALCILNPGMSMRGTIMEIWRKLIITFPFL